MGRSRPALPACSKPLERRSRRLGARTAVALSWCKVVGSAPRELSHVPAVKARMRPTLALALGIALALHGAGALANASPDAAALAGNEGSVAVPVWNSSNGKLEAVLWIDTTTLGARGDTRSAFGMRWIGGSNLGSASVSAAPEPGYGLLCGNASGAVDRLGDGCLVTQLGRPAALPAGQLSAQAGTRIGRSEWLGFSSLRRGSTDSLLPGTSLAARLPELAGLTGAPGLGFEEHDLGIVGELKLGQQGWVRVGGSVARARLMPASGILPGSVAPRWNSQTLSVGAGYGALGGEVIGRVVRVPGEPEAYSTLGLGLTWRTPWAGRLTVGAQNLLSTGDNPVVPRPKSDAREEGRVPYVRYQQDL